MPDLPALTHLDLRDSEITTFDGAPALAALTHLDLSFTKIELFAGIRDRRS